MNSGVNYSLFYDILLNLREDFHSYGRIDDSNAKLDEIVKIICISYSLALNNVKFSLAYVRSVAKSELGDENKIAEGLKFIFEQEVQNSLFKNADGTNIFGSNASLAIQPTEDDFAQNIITEIEKIDFIYLIKNRNYGEFDIINECFGHFVRENFRNNKEDAQYMTPYEISNPILDIIFSDMKKSKYFEKNSFENFTVMDPTCGVGTLLMASSSHFTKFVESTIKDTEKRNSIIEHFRSNGIIGQDKVDRMVRLSKVNALLLGSNASNITSGNSIVGKSNIDSYRQSIDLIFTNPPFGAEYETKKLNFTNYPLFNQMENKTPKTLTSELLLLDRCIDLLKTGGYLAIVLPDSVFTSKGINSYMRDAIVAQCKILGVVGLPSVTFAQAGTRTNTCVLILRKESSNSKEKIFMADCKDLGYLVKERAGVPVKVEHGKNEMEDIAKSLTRDIQSDDKIISQSPSVTLINKNELIGNNLKPSFYAASRFQTIAKLTSNIKVGYKIVKLMDIVDFVTKEKKSFMVSDEIKHISVLHINDNCTIAFDEVENFNPISKGRQCDEGELIFSRINPRIPRMAVIPQYKKKLVCSNEFEIMRSKDIIGMNVLCFLLKTESVKTQIENLTSGTSSSHSRIKTEQLENILIPIPTTNESIMEMKSVEKKLKRSIQEIYNAEDNISEQYKILNTI